MAVSSPFISFPYHTPERLHIARHSIATRPFARVYLMYIQKAECKGRTKKVIDRIICWLTSYTLQEVQQHLTQGSNLATFFAQAPAINPNRVLIKGVICGSETHVSLLRVG